MPHHGLVYLIEVQSTYSLPRYVNGNTQHLEMYTDWLLLEPTYVLRLWMNKA